MAASSVTVAPANTARTASRRCSTTDNTTTANPGLPKFRRPTETSNSVWPNPITVAHQLASMCVAHQPAQDTSTTLLRCRIWLQWIKSGRFAPAPLRVWI